MSRLTREEVEERLQHLRANEEVGLLIPVEDLCVDLLVAWADRDKWRAEALAARELLGLPGLELMWDAKDLDGWTRKRALYATARAANGEE